jgi:Glyoxalase-like domain
VTLGYFKDTCLDAADPGRVGPFWATMLGLDWEAHDDGDGVLTGPTPQHTIWINKVPELKTVKNRVHLDVYVRRLADLEALGARVLRPEGDNRRWTVMADPEGAEFCAFLRPELPAQRMHGLVVDSANPRTQARWWAEVFDQPTVDHGGVVFTVEGPSGAPFTMDFVPVPEPKSVKNRVHWDITAAGVKPLLDAGATIVRQPDGDISWHVLADPEGNEFCAFAPKE